MKPKVGRIKYKDGHSLVELVSGKQWMMACSIQSGECPWRVLPSAPRNAERGVRTGHHHTTSSHKMCERVCAAERMRLELELCRLHNLGVAAAFLDAFHFAHVEARLKPPNAAVAMFVREKNDHGLE
jgi:hypothetical protein